MLNSLAVPRGASIAVFGTGAVGLAAVMAARINGANPIIGVDLKARRLELALELGATHAIDNRQEDVVSRIKEITGSAEMYRAAVQVLNPRGTVALIANPGGGGSLPGGRKIRGIIQGDAVPQQFIPKLIDLYQARQFPFDRLVKFYDFSEINRAIADAKSGDTIKPVLQISAD